jgi:PIN domain nuclease of toxin-antitoxin system
MKILLDTHAFIWFVSGDPRLGAHARQLIEAPENHRLLSVASLWEMAIKISLGKLSIGTPFPVLVERHVVGNAIDILAISPEHLDQLVILPFYHKDPFDRLIIAQSEQENIPVLSCDEAFDNYGVERYWGAGHG